MAISMLGNIEWEAGRCRKTLNGIWMLGNIGRDADDGKHEWDLDAGKSWVVCGYGKILGGMQIPENIEWDADAGNIGLDSDDGKREVKF